MKFRLILGLALAFASSASAGLNLDFDNRFYEQGHLKAIGANNYIMREFYRYGQGGPLVAVIDGGFNTNHPSLAGKIKNSIDYTGKPVASQSTGNLHGTHVTGLITANGRTVTGLSPGSKVLAITYLTGRDTTRDARYMAMAKAVRLAHNRGARVINISQGVTQSLSSSAKKFMRDILAYVTARGSVVVLAAGNAGKELKKGVFESYPQMDADIPGVILVGATMSASGELAGASNYSSSLVDIAAPGAESRGYGLLSTYDGSNFARKGGTSMAAPIVASAASLVMNYLNGRKVQYTAGQIERILIAGSKTISSFKSKIAGGRSLALGNLLSRTKWFSSFRKKFIGDHKIYLNYNKYSDYAYSWSEHQFNQYGFTSQGQTLTLFNKWDSNWDSNYRGIFSCVNRRTHRHFISTSSNCSGHISGGGLGGLLKYNNWSLATVPVFRCQNKYGSQFLSQWSCGYNKNLGLLGYAPF